MPAAAVCEYVELRMAAVADADDGWWWMTTRWGRKLMKTLVRLTVVLLVAVVALSGTAYAKVPPSDPDAVPGYDVPPPAPVVVETGLSVMQTVGLMLAAAAVTAVLTLLVHHFMLRTPVHAAP
jgi:hypothetical protein